MAAVLLVWVAVAKTPNHAYRLTVEVETPSGVKRGSVVRHVFAPCPGVGSTTLFPIGASPQTSVVGEAVFIDLGEGRNLVALMAAGPRADDVDQPVSLVWDAMMEARLINQGVTDHTKRIRLCDVGKFSGVVPLSAKRAPTLVTFTDLADPASARVVEPTVTGFAAAFGLGFRPAGVTLEMVPAGVWPFTLIGLSGTSVTRGIEGKMPIIMTTLIAKSRIAGQTEHPNDPYIAKSGQFLRGF